MDIGSIAYAMGTAGQQGGSTGGGGPLESLSPFFPLILMVVIFYFLLIRPQQKKQKDHRSMLQNLQKGDVVVTQGGIQGTIRGLTETVVTIEIAENVRIKVQRPFVTGVVSKGEPTE
jgi:preprotein translocase subunit YajC